MTATMTKQFKFADHERAKPIKWSACDCPQHLRMENMSHRVWCFQFCVFRILGNSFE